MAEDTSRFQITRIRANNFRSIRKLDLELGPLTVLVGPNASGKSNVMDVVRFVAEALGSSLTEAIERRGGLHAIRHWMPHGKIGPIELEITAQKDERTLTYRFSIKSNRAGAFQVEEEDLTMGIVNRPAGNIRIHVKDGVITFTASSVSSGVPQVTDLNTGDQTISPQDLVFSNLRLALIDWAMALGSLNKHDPIGAGFRRWASLLRDIADVKLYNISPPAIRKSVATSPSLILKESGDNIVQVLNEMQSRRSRRLSDIKSYLPLMVQQISDFTVKQNENTPVLTLRHTFNQNTENPWFGIHQESDGTLRLLAIAVALNQHAPPPFIGLEEPEVAVHPNSMGVLAELIQTAAYRGQVMITTQSPDLVDRLPVDSIKAVEHVDGETVVGNILSAQTRAIDEHIFTAGELHSLEGLKVEPIGLRA